MGELRYCGRLVCLVCPAPWFPLALSAIIPGINFSANCSFSAHVQELAQKGNYALILITFIHVHVLDFIHLLQ